jgi:aminoglycoside 6'-N-acetyltransferase
MITFTPLAKQHFPLLSKWLKEPHVLEWWPSDEDVTMKYSPYTEGYKIEQGHKKSIHPFIIVYQGLNVGYIQYYNAFDFPRDDCAVSQIWKEPLSLAALDFYLGDPTVLRQGIGTAALIAFLQERVYPHFEACLVDPDKNNIQAIKTYGKAGFSKYQETDKYLILIARNSQKNPHENYSF